MKYTFAIAEYDVTRHDGRVADAYWSVDGSEYDVADRCGMGPRGYRRAFRSGKFPKIAHSSVTTRPPFLVAAKIAVARLSPTMVPCSIFPNRSTTKTSPGCGVSMTRWCWAARPSPGP